MTAIDADLQPGCESDALALGLSADEFACFRQRLKRTPNRLELTVVSALWSEHCSYKSSRCHLAKLPSEAAWVLQGPGENAGAVAIGNGLAVVFKIESHNHPSFIEPFHGAATGVGGILRDIFTMGARPVACLNVLRFGALSDHRTRYFLDQVVAGIASYGNCIGVPTVGGSTRFCQGYNRNILVNAMCVGISKSDKLCSAAASGVGNPLVYVGAATGRDGIHGASMASQAFADQLSPKTTVQVANPYLGQCLLEACLELIACDAVVAVQDMGAAGLTSSSAEMAAKGGVGVRLDLDSVPVRAAGMLPSELMLSESQERMLLVIKPDQLSRAGEIFRRRDLDHAVIGRVQTKPEIVLCWHGQTIATLPLASLDPPVLKHPYTIKSRTGYLRIDDSWPLPAVSDALMTLAAHPDNADVKNVYQQYDWLIGGQTVYAPGTTGRYCADAAVVAVDPAAVAQKTTSAANSPSGQDSRLYIALTVDSTSRYVSAAPVEGGRQIVAEAYRNLCAVGATPLGVTDNLNFGNPENPEVMGQLVGAIDGIATACKALDMPVVSGNVSLYNETNGHSIPPTPVIGAVGLLRSGCSAEELARRGYGFTQAGSLLYLLGQTDGWLGCSLWAERFAGANNDDNAPPPVDLTAERRNGTLVRDLIACQLVRGCHDVSDGGTAIALAELLCAARIGASVQTPELFRSSTAGRHRFWFGEDQARYLLAVPPGGGMPFLAKAKQAGNIAVTFLGHSNAKLELSIDSDPVIPLQSLADAFASVCHYEQRYRQFDQTSG